MRRGVPERPLYPRKRTLVAQERFGPNKRTLDVRFTPESGHKWLWRWMSASDPTRTFDLIGYQRQGSAINGHSQGPSAMTACGSESGRSENAPQTAGSDPKPTLNILYLQSSHASKPSPFEAFKRFRSRSWQSQFRMPMPPLRCQLSSLFELLR